MGRPTMNDVAAAAGVALKTVSRVVNDEPGVNPATADRVRAAIERLGYRRNDSAATLRSGRTASIGLVIEDAADPFYSGLSRAVEDVALRHGYLMFTGSSSEDPARERELVLAFCARRVDGLVIVPAGNDHEYLTPELDAGISAVFADRPSGSGRDLDTVLCDNAGGARSGVAHLIAHGHRRIGFIADAPSIFTATQRWYGYREALTQAELPYDPALIAMGPPEPTRVLADVERLLALPDPPTALFTGNGRTTVATLRALNRPIALVGFDDFDLADLLGITVVAQNPAGLGKAAADLLFSRLSGNRDPAQRRELPTQLIARGSGEGVFRLF
ncbi:LacI family DNA-binding transcriptional regulator [Acrocarpospora macrocephala]|uniref:LacI family transcriptional regulator n=1 Tax=Acrocarpospora macrocephala TaxID=150177 RepID=A0A5M3WNH8_9ACTN|nr:LacI family DNA-binding transcriptional regulator [Acrocarpospora macrocephala]GES10857.1 LacI family transcriptional regulator [Acrocarpospora macrocephala]